MAKVQVECGARFLLYDGLPDIYALREKEGILGKNAVEHYAKYLKTTIQVGSELDETATKPLSLPIEIVPSINPFGLKVRGCHAGYGFLWGEGFWLMPHWLGVPLARAKHLLAPQEQMRAGMPLCR